LREERFYPIIEEFLKKKGFECKKKLVVNLKTAIEKYGQKSWHFDILGYGDKGTWAIECKQSCALGQFSLALGQLIAYKHLIGDDFVRNKLESKVKLCAPFFFSLALVESEQWPIRQQTNTFKAICDSKHLPFGFLLITKDQKVQEIIPATPFSY